MELSIRNIALILLLNILSGSMLVDLHAQQTFSKQLKRSRNLLVEQGTYLKTIFSFKPEERTAVDMDPESPHQGQGYENEFIVPYLYDAVFDQEMAVYAPERITITPMKNAKICPTNWRLSRLISI